MGISLDITNILPFVENFDRSMSDVARARKLLFSGEGRGSDSLGWLNPKTMCSEAEHKKIKDIAEKIKNESEVLLVIGIGGSYLGTKAALDFILSPNYNSLKRYTPAIIFSGTDLSPESIRETEKLLEGRLFSINVVSKSGGTTEPMASFRYFRNLLEKQVGEEKAKERIYVTTGKTGVLRAFSEERGYKILDIPENVGGRYSVLSACAFLPLYTAGIECGDMTAGAETVMRQGRELSPENFPGVYYAASRNALYRSGKKIEILASFEPALNYTGEWWRQLFGESEGKGGRGIFPTCVSNTADLHSMGQYIQQGERSMFETFLLVRDNRERVTVPQTNGGDGLDFLAGKDFGWMNSQVARAVSFAHFEGGVPNMTVTVEERSAKCFGEMAAFFELSCALSGYTLGIDPFDQPGVENYKSNMQALLGNPKYKNKRLPAIGS